MLTAATAAAQSTTILTELKGQRVSLAAEPAADVQTGTWYAMFDRGYTGSHPHGFLYENATTHTLYNTATRPEGEGSVAGRFLVRLSDAGDGRYYIQTGYGNYFAPFRQGQAVSVTATATEPVTVAKIGGTDGHFYLQAGTTGIVLDANDLSKGDATVVGWGTTPPSATGGNNDWAFYPVTIEPDPYWVSSLAALTTGWYRMRIAVPAEHAGKYALNASNEYAYNADPYPLSYQATAAEPEAADALYYVRIVRSGSTVQIQSTNGHYLTDLAKATATGAQLAVAYDGSFRIGSYFTPFSNSGGRIIGKSSSASTSRFTLFRVPLDEAGLTPWTVRISGGAATSQLTCTRNTVTGLRSVYTGGYFFFPTDEPPTATDFTAEGLAGVSINAATHVVTATIDPDIALFENGVSVGQGYQTAGRAGDDAVLLHITLSPFNDIETATINIRLHDGTAECLQSIALVESSSVELHAAASPKVLATAEPSNDTIRLATGALTKGTHHLWLTAKVLPTAPLGTILDAAMDAVTYIRNGTRQQLTIQNGNPTARGAMVTEVQRHVFVPTTYASNHYRIPALCVAPDGSLLAAADKRYSSASDIGGGHVIDIVVRRSTDGGITWSDPVTVAKGNNSSDATCGYGDPSLTTGSDGRIYCLFAAGNTGYFYGLRRIAFCTSDDNGRTWTAPVDIYETGMLNDHTAYGLYDYFVTSGHGICTPEGILMYLLCCQPYTNAGQSAHTSGSDCYMLYSADQGASWHIAPSAAYTGGDEAKLAMDNNGRLIASVRQAGNRGFNRGTYRVDGTGTPVFTWGSQWRNAQLYQQSANNQDILYYSRETDDEPDIVLHTMTTGSHANLVLYMSLDKGTTWRAALTIQPGGARYATMARLDNGDLGLLYEDYSLGQGKEYPVNFIRITRQQLLDSYVALGGKLTGIEAISYGEHGSDTQGTTPTSRRHDGYDLAGRRVSDTSRHGIYILRGGRKLVVR